MRFCVHDRLAERAGAAVIGVRDRIGVHRHPADGGEDANRKCSEERKCSHALYKRNRATLLHEVRRLTAPPRCVRPTNQKRRLNKGTMLRFTAILIAFCVAFTAALHAAKPEDASNESAKKPESVEKEGAAPKTERLTKTEPRSKSDKPEVRKKRALATDDDDSTDGPTKPAANKAPSTKEAAQKIQTQHTNFQAKPSATIASAQFNPNYRIETSQDWTGPQYEIFRSYQPEWHDETWYRSRYGNNLRLIAGGWYFWEGGYWLPAWGYDQSASYYPYDGPIYVGQNPRPFDQVVADVQAALQQQGLYRGEVDGLVGPLTRQALAAYQSAHALPPTAAIDQPTLESLGLG